MLKYKIYVLLLFFLGVLSLNIVNASNNNLDLLGKIIYIDVGHGGIDSGANYDNIKEKEINLSVSLKLEEKLTKKGAIVYLTRYADYDLALPNVSNRKRSDLIVRSELINKEKTDLFISIHLNADDTGIYKGPQVFYNNNNYKNELFGKIVQNEMNKELNGNRKIKNDNKLFLLKQINKCGVLVEIGFLSNDRERYLLKQNSYQNKIANIISKAIVYYFRQT